MKQKEGSIISQRVYDIPDEEDVIELVMPMDGTKLIVIEPGSNTGFFSTEKRHIFL